MPARRSRYPVRFTISGDEGELIFPIEGLEVDIEFNKLLGRLDAGKTSETRFRQRVRDLVKLHPWFIDGHLELAYAFIEDGDPERALTHAMNALQECTKAIPEEFTGTIPWSRHSNRPLHDAASCVAHCHSILRERSRAIEIMKQQLAWDPDDDQGVHLLIGSEYLRAEQFSVAEAVFQDYAADYPPYHYELGLLQFLREDFIAAATSLRRGFAANPYIAETLCGSVQPLPMKMWHASEFARPYAAGHYVRDYGMTWFEVEFSVSFVRWLFNHSKVMMERARLQGIREAMLWEEPGSERARLAVDESDALQRIDDTLSETIVQIHTDEYGLSDFPWKYPFSPETESDSE